MRTLNLCVVGLILLAGSLTLTNVVAAKNQHAETMVVHRPEARLRWERLRAEKVKTAVALRAGADCSNLPLRLRPGERNDAGNVTDPPPKGVPAGAIAVDAPLIPGARRARNLFGDAAGPALPASPYVKTAVAQFVVSRPVGSVMSWYRLEYRGCGGYSWAGSGVFNADEWFLAHYVAAYQSLELEMLFKAGRKSNTTRLEYYAVAVTSAPRPNGAYLSKPEYMSVNYVLSDSSSKPDILRTTLRSTNDISAVVTAINGLQPHEGISHCSALLQARLEPHYRGSRTREVIFGSCGEVEVGKFDLADTRLAWTVLSEVVYKTLYQETGNRT